VAADRWSLHLGGVAELTRASLALRVAAPQRATGLLGRVEPSPTAPSATAEQLRVARILGRTVARDARRLPWHPTCLRQAVAVQRMLRRRGIPGRLHLGVASIADAEAHAWVTVGDQPVIGAREQERFVPLAVFV
jgi:Transglutaminase-like superfamily